MKLLLLMIIILIPACAPSLKEEPVDFNMIWLCDTKGCITIML